MPTDLLRLEVLFGLVGMGAGAPGSPTQSGRMWSRPCAGVSTRRGCRWTHSRS